MMAISSSYTTGTASVAAGGTVVTGQGTTWAAGIMAGDRFWAAGYGVRILSVDSNTQLTLAYAWPGATRTAAAYEIVYTPDAARVLGTTRDLLDKFAASGPSSSTPLMDGTAAVGTADAWARGDHRHPSDTAKVNVSGGTMTGDLTVTKLQPFLTLNKTGGTSYYSALSGQKSGVNRWLVVPGDGVAESGGNAGSDFGISRFADDGAYAGTPLRIRRSDGRMLLEADPIDALGAATKQYADGKVSKAGDTISDWLAINGSYPSLILDGVAGHPANIAGRAGGKYRWTVAMIDGAAETGGNAGSGFAISRHGDDGVYISTPFYINRASGYVTLSGSVVVASAALYPIADGGVASGAASNRWSTVYASTGTINTSDGALKARRGAFTDAELDAWGDVHAIVYQWLDAVAEKGEAGARLHAGWIAQDVAAAFEAHGLDPSRYGLWCSDEVTRTVRQSVTRQVPVTAPQETSAIEIRDGVPTLVRRTVDVPVVQSVPVVDEAGAAVLDADGNPISYDVPEMTEETIEIDVEEQAGTRLGLRYDECLVIEAAWMRRELARAIARIAALEQAGGADAPSGG
jgi:hypothetical protein